MVEPPVEIKNNKIDWYLRFAWLLTLCAIILITGQYTISKVNSCTTDPLEYAVNSFKVAYSENVSVSGTFTVFLKGKPYMTYFGDGSEDKNKPTYISMNGQLKFNLSKFNIS